MAEASPPPPKKDVARAFLLRGNVFVHLDPRVPGVDVPAHLANQPEMVLQIGLDMPIPIPDLRVDDDGIHGTLSFARSPFLCRVPWDAVFAIVDHEGRGKVWPESIPAEIAVEITREAERRAREPATPSPQTAARSKGRRQGTQPQLAPAPQANPQPGRESFPVVRAITGGAPRPPRGEPQRKKVPRELPPYLRIVK